MLNVMTASMSGDRMPSAMPTSPIAVHGGTIRAAVLAARRAHQFRQKQPEHTAVAASGVKFLRLQDDDSIGDAFRAASPVNSLGSSGAVRPPPQHVKKNLNLRLDLGGVKPPDLPLMTQLHQAGVPPPAPSLPTKQQLRAQPDQDHRQAQGPVSYPANIQASERRRSSFFMAPASDTKQRRKSSVTLSMSSPEAAEFRVVAQDGPAELGRRTKRIKKLGRGAGGTVYLGVYVPALKLVAVKDVTVYKDAERRMVQHELHALHENVAPLGVPSDGANRSAQNERCPFIMGFYGAYLRPSKGAVSIVAEFMELGSMQDLLDAQHTISEDVLRHAAFCCLTALDHMHARRMVHRDIKPANILINRHGDFKIADFGLAGTLAQSDSFFSEFEGTIMYMAPERISGENYGCVSDVWSLGVALFYLATGVYPFAVDDGFFGLEEAICTDPQPPMPNRFSPTCRDFMKGLLRRDPSERMTANQALQHPFLGTNYWGSAKHNRFRVIWLELALPSCITAGDVETLAAVIADQAERYPHIVNLSPSPSGRDGRPVEPTKPEFLRGSPRTFFADMSRMFAGKTAATALRTDTQASNGHNAAEVADDPLAILAEECGVSSAYLRDRIQQEIRKAQLY